jgi:hypothetical protein
VSHAELCRNTVLSNANDALTAKFEIIGRTQHDIEVTRGCERTYDKNITRVVLKAFGWEQTVVFRKVPRIARTAVIAEQV